MMKGVIGRGSVNLDVEIAAWHTIFAMLKLGLDGWNRLRKLIIIFTKWLSMTFKVEYLDNGTIVNTPIDQEPCILIVASVPRLVEHLDSFGGLNIISLPLNMAVTLEDLHACCESVGSHHAYLCPFI